jgi:hypothetical protein
MMFKYLIYGAIYVILYDRVFFWFVKKNEKVGLIRYILFAIPFGCMVPLIVLWAGGELEVISELSVNVLTAGFFSIYVALVYWLIIRREVDGPDANPV